MATVQDIKRRVRSVRNTRKITKAMELVAAAKLRRAEARIQSFRDYAERMRELMIGTARATPARSFPLMEARDQIGTVAIVPLTGDRVVLVYNHYVSALTQTVEVEEILPIPRTALEEDDEKSAHDIALEGDIIYEPEPEIILARLLPTYLETTIYRALLESAASEHGARMTAMRNASKNAGELIDRLTLEMNRARQAEITQEILEVVAGADALTG